MSEQKENQEIKIEDNESEQPKKSNFRDKHVPKTQLSKMIHDQMNDPVDELIKDQTWEDLDEVAEPIANGIISYATTINSLIDVEGLYPYIEDPEGLKVLIDGMRRDLEDLSKQFADIKRQHDGKSGPIKDEDELFECISIFGQYEELSRVLTGVLTPTHIEITMAFKEAIDKKNAAEAKENEQKDVKETEEIKDE